MNGSAGDSGGRRSGSIPPARSPRSRSRRPTAARSRSICRFERFEELKLQPGETVYVSAKRGRVFAPDYVI